MGTIFAVLRNLGSTPRQLVPEHSRTARVAAMNKLNSAAQVGTLAAKRNLLRDAAALSLLSLIPPDRVCCIRKLRLGHTLKRKSRVAGG